MAEAPERIEMDRWALQDLSEAPLDMPPDATVEFVRADIHEAAVEALRAVVACTWRIPDEGGRPNAQALDAARAALALSEKGNFA